MDILRYIKSLFFLITWLIFISCETKYTEAGAPNSISIEKWGNLLPKKVSLMQFEKNTNFSEIEKKDTVFIIDTINVSKGDINIKFNDFSEFPQEKDFILTIDAIKYKLSEIKWTKDTIKAGMGDSWRITRYSNEMRINGKIYNSYLGFGFPKEAIK